MTATEYVILVNEHNQEIGHAEKISVHKSNLLHRAFSVFIFRKCPQVELMLQQRALDKYHSAGLWTNTCCSHPRPGEDIIQAAMRRLQEELGIVTTLKHLGWFHYNAHFPNKLSENEIDHVLLGEVSPNITIKPNPAEIHAYRWISIAELQKEITSHPEQFTSWLQQSLDLVKKNIF
ncbi:MAG TPA: isopentenyl-diphosphate Delta-isomerase [Gammaproteobacteria bacterium]|nr:isopentenyl-diphosphate Delta-isomerase [Gammaproteobacteria bacterium]